MLTIGITLGQESQSSQPDSTLPPIGPLEVRTILLQEDGVPTASSFARLNTSFPELFSFTVCYRIYLLRFREESTLMSYAVSENKDNELRMDHRLTGYKVSLHSRWAKTVLETPLNQWAHFCISFHHPTGEWKIYLDGEMTDKGAFPMTSESLVGSGAYIIGQEQDSFGGGFQRDQSFSGEITQLNFWSRVLDEGTIRKFASCAEEEAGDALAWDSQVWDVYGKVRWMVRQKDDICQQQKRSFTIFPDRFSLSEALHLCQVVGGIIAVPQTDEENAWLYNESKIHDAYCSGGQSSYLWLGANDEKVERQWVYWGTGEPIPWESKWRGDGPNGGTVENCLVLLSGTFPGRWSDIACLDTYSFCVPCEFETRTSIYLKGPAMCEGSPFNLQYMLGDSVGGRPALVGFLHTDIFWDQERGSWVMRSLKDSDAVATWTPIQEGMYPFGNQEWHLETEVCGIPSGGTVNLTLSVCGAGMFTCNDGRCISLKQRCDLRVDCADQSDESRCSIVDLPEGYHIAIPPPAAAGNQTLPIFFTVNIIAFPTIVTQDLTFVASMQLKLRWQDTRLNFLNLHDDRTLNLLSEEAVASVWTPRVFFRNARGNIFTNLERGSRVEGIRQGEARPGPPSRPEEVNIYPGYESSLEMSQLYSVTYSCDFELLMFPFDAQLCRLHFELVSASSSYMTLIPSGANYTGQNDLIEYTIGKVSIKMDEEGEFSSVSVYVRFQRRYVFYLLTLYIPSTLLIIIAYATFFFNPQDFNSRIVVALTSLLVLSSLYTQTSNSLPKTSYFKLVDIWLFFSIVMIFIVVLLQTLIDFSATFTRKNFLRVCCTGSSETDKSQNSARNNITKIVVSNNMSNDEQHSRAISNGWIQDESALPLRYRTPNVYPVNIPLMIKSRFLIPFIFSVFNMAYWGSALTYLHSIED
ncbi:putative glycine receptor subunit alpha-4 isoform X3 [Penaeus vannamei]|uniref:Putative glycine receptor subunit alpha-4 isoform X3 n=2 Tax=Penaeus vannamei TaxID=6689 RepID=A0A423TQQ5_PENVA|nr:putative glycine receptor subunit alpha-4 isoform X3 [Penaeus vannamei]